MTGNYIRFIGGFPVTSFDDEGVPVSISTSSLGLIIENPLNGMPQVLIRTDMGVMTVGIPEETIKRDALHVASSLHLARDKPA